MTEVGQLELGTKLAKMWVLTFRSRRKLYFSSRRSAFIRLNYHKRFIVTAEMNIDSETVISYRLTLCLVHKIKTLVVSCRRQPR